MNWDAVGALGEVVGAFAVVATLFYFSVQIRRYQTEQFLNLLAIGQEIEFQFRDKMESSAELLSKANNNVELTDIESYRLRQLARMTSARYFHPYMRLIETDGDTSILVCNMAIELVDSPDLLKEWRAVQSEHERRQEGLSIERAIEWRMAIEKDIELLSSKGGT